MDLPALREVADQCLRGGVELVGDDIQIAVSVQIEEGRRPRSERSHHGDLALLVLAGESAPIRLAIAVGVEPGGVRAPALARLDAQDELAVHEALSSVVQEDGVDAVPEREAHAGGNEDVVETIRVQVSDARTP